MSNKQTAVEWLVKQLEGDDSKIARVIGLKKYNSLIQQAKEMEKQQIVFAQMDMFNHINKDEFGLNYLNKRDAAEEFAEQYYNEEYGKP